MGKPVGLLSVLEFKKCKPQILLHPNLSWRGRRKCTTHLGDRVSKDVQAPCELLPCGAKLQEEGKHRKACSLLKTKEIVKSSVPAFG